MAIANGANNQAKTVGDPCASYESVAETWKRCRAVCGGEAAVKDYDTIIDVNSFSNFLIPFSPSMSQAQFNFYRAEAELPGITTEFKKMIIGGLLRKPPVLKVPSHYPEEAKDWIINAFGSDDAPLISFLSDALDEELQTSRSWIFLDYPSIPEPEFLTKEELQQYKPYPILQRAESVINWRMSTNAQGKPALSFIVVKGTEEFFEEGSFHPSYRETVWAHLLNEQGNYQIEKYQLEENATNIPIVHGRYVQQHNGPSNYVLKEVFDNILINGEPFKFIPAWPLNGSVEIIEPVLTSLINKEISLYNKLSRRNHLLYGACTYTPWLATDMLDDDFKKIVEQGLGSWMRINKEDKVGVLSTPTEALQDMEKTIGNGFEETAKLGIRMLTPETSQSGVALELRNASQTAQLGALNTKASYTMKQVIAVMLEWRYGKPCDPKDVEFSLADDFSMLKLDANWMRLVTEWYESGKIPRSIWLSILKQNDIVEPDYDDEAGKSEINEDELIMGQKSDPEYAKRISKEFDK